MPNRKLVAGDEEAPGAVRLDARPPAEVAASRARVAGREVAEELPLVRRQLVLLLVEGERPDVGAAEERVGELEDPREDLDRHLVRFLLHPLPVHDRAALDRAA